MSGTCSLQCEAGFLFKGRLHGVGRAAGESGHEEVGHGAFGGQTLVVAKLALDVRGKKK